MAQLKYWVIREYMYLHTFMSLACLPLVLAGGARAENYDDVIKEEEWTPGVQWVN